MIHQCLLVVLALLGMTQPVLSRIAIDDAIQHGAPRKPIFDVPADSTASFADDSLADDDFDFTNDEGFMQLIQQIQDTVAKVEESMPEETRQQLEVKRKTMDELDKKLMRLREEAEKANAEAEELRQEVQELEKEKKERKQHVKEMRTDIDRLNRQKKQLAEMVDDLAEMVAEDGEADEDDDSQEQLDDVNKEISDVATKLEKERATKREVKRKLHIQSDRLAKAEGRYKRAKKDVKDAQEEMEKEELAIDGLTKDYQGAFMKALVPEEMADGFDFENFDLQKMMEDEGLDDDEDDDSELFGPKQQVTAPAA